MLKKASCSNCNQALPLDCGFFEFKLPAKIIQCPRCKQVMNSTFAYRTTWTGQQIFRATTILTPVVLIISAMRSGMPFGAAAVLGGGFGLIAGMLAGALLSEFLSVPVQLVLEVVFVAGKRREKELKDLTAKNTLSGKKPKR